MSCIDISQRGLLSLAKGNHIQVWQDGLSTKQQSPYLDIQLPCSSQSITHARFRPFEDVIGAGHAEGFTSAIVPGSGEPNIDTMVANPFAHRKQRREAEVAALLDKADVATIVLNPTDIGAVVKDVGVEERRAKRLEYEAIGKDWNPKDKAKGKNKIGRLQKRKRKGLYDMKIAAKKKQLVEQGEEQRRLQKLHKERVVDKKQSALDRFK